jgi:ABC-type thiamin/hydroxymethylpyrimidine transport system permease subunit
MLAWKSVLTRSVGGGRPLRWCMRRLVTTLLRRCTTAAVIGEIIARCAETKIEVGTSTMTEAIVGIDRDRLGGEIALAACLIAI